jgi:ATP-binding cassette subfamily B protein
MPKNSNINPSADRLILRTYWRGIMAHKRTAAIAALNPLAAIFNSVLVPFFASGALARLAHHDQSAASFIYGMAGAAVIGTALNRVSFQRLMTLQAEVMSDLHELVFTRLLQRSTGFHTNQISGKLVSDALDFVNSFGSLLNGVYISGMPLVFIIVTGLIIVFASEWVLGVYVLGVVIITLVWAWLESRTRYNLRNTRLVAQKDLTGHLSDSIVNAQTVKTFAREQDEMRTNSRLNARLLDLRLTDWHRAGRSGNTRVAVLLAMQVLLLLLISYLSDHGTDVLAAGFFAFTYVFIITTRLFDLNNIIRQVEEALLQAAPIAVMLAEPVEVTDRPNAAELTVAEGSIEFRGVQFHYAETPETQAVFDDLTINIAPGERIGLVGPSGGGKSTLTRLLLRFEDLDGGQILIDGQDISAVTQASLRRAIAYVPQEPLLFHRSIRHNIAYGHPKATEADIWAAAAKAQAKDFIANLPHGLDTIVGERGVKLSGGQRQRVAIARAILKNAQILVLDEATSALDSESEVEIQKAMWELMQGRTAIVIAHRLSTIQRMDRIIVLDDGAITEIGTHQQLLDNGGLYATLWNHQSGGFIS